MKQSSNVHPAAQLIRAFEFMRAVVFFQHPFFSNINFPPAAKLWYHFSLWLIHGQLYCILLLAVTQILDQPSATKYETVGFCKTSLDIDQPFREFIDEFIDADQFRAQFYDMQQHVTDRSAHHKWASQLRFLTPIENPGNYEDIATHNELEGDGLDSGYTDGSFGFCECSEISWPIWDPNERTARLAEPGECPDCTQYVAVSYCWKGQELANTDNQAFKVRRTQGERDSKARLSVLSRAIKYSNIHKLRYIWIDQECIEQDNLEDKEAGIQSMDLVYQQSAYPVGIIDCYFDKQSHIDMLELIMEGENFALDQMGDLIDMLELLKNDPWFTRAWVLQECVAAGWHMPILIQHDPNLEKPSLFGGLEGELMISFFKLHCALGWVTNRLDHLSNEREQHSDLIRKLRDVVRALDDVYPPPLYGPDCSKLKDPASRQVCNAAEALYYLQNRYNSRIPDRLTIFSNLCNYAVRINTTLMEERGYSFSTCALILSILNGDTSLILNRKPSKTSTKRISLGLSLEPDVVFNGILPWMSHSIQFGTSTPPETWTMLHGLAIEGYFWKCGQIIGMQDIRERFQKRWQFVSKDEWLKAEIMWVVIQSLFVTKFQHCGALIDAEDFGTLALRTWFKLSLFSESPLLAFSSPLYRVRT